jgi:CheY-like chemotaxis protein
MSMLVDEVPDIVVTDLQMPKVNGLELIKHLRRSYPQVPGILITAQGSEELSAEALKVGAAAYLPKSQVGEELNGTIEHVLELLNADFSYKDLLDRLDYHEFQFTLGNDPSMIGPLVNLMQQMAAGVQTFDDVVRTRIGMAVEQALHNAIYRGNLEISRQEQLDDEEFETDGELSLVEQRRRKPPYANRRVHFRAHLGKLHMAFMVRDDGNGFDVSQLPTSQDPKQLDIDGGRGLVLIRSFMDEVRFNDKGNEITMTKSTASLVK